MDQERYEKDKEVYSNFKYPNSEEKFYNYRLITDDEVPEWLKEEVIYC